ncbi:MAG: Flp pilus assembly protein CpaB [Deltaproteobacteria bacterium]|nr:Flp pilus assembly protein CpaB [Deltaproteobacteria bacterium]
MYVSKTSGFSAKIKPQKPKAKLWLVGVVILSISVIFILSALSDNSESKTVVQVEPVEEFTSILVPVRDIQVGEQLASSLFRFEKRPASTIPPGTITSMEELNNKFARVPLAMGMMINKEHLVETKPTNLITANIPEGYRAITIRVNETSSVEGWARPGANVDVLWVSDINGKQGLTTIVENAKVLSAERQIDPNSGPDATVPSTVTLLVSSQDAAKIQLASTTGTLSLLLRGDNDLSSSSLRTAITVDDLLGKSGVSKDKKPHKGQGTVRIGADEFYLIDGELVPADKNQE